MHAFVSCNTTNFESLDIGSSCSDVPFISREYGSSSHMNVIGSKCSFAGGHALDWKVFLFTLCLMMMMMVIVISKFVVMLVLMKVTVLLLSL